LWPCCRALTTLELDSLLLFGNPCYRHWSFPYLVSRAILACGALLARVDPCKSHRRPQPWSISDHERTSVWCPPFTRIHSTTREIRAVDVRRFVGRRIVTLSGTQMKPYHDGSAEILLTGVAPEMFTAGWRAEGRATRNLLVNKPHQMRVTRRKQMPATADLSGQHDTNPDNFVLSSGNIHNALIPNLARGEGRFNLSRLPPISGWWPQFPMLHTEAVIS